MKNITAVIFIAIFAVVLVWWVGLPAKPARVLISENNSARQIARALRNANAIASETVFVAAVKMMGRAKQLKTGEYVIPARTSVFGVIRLLSSGKGAYIRVTIPEGWTAADIAEALSARGIVDREKFLKLLGEKQLEGYLFPETYFFEKSLPEQVVADRMTGEFDRVFTSEMQQRADELKMGKNKIIVLASIIENEAVRPNERELISGVFYNRLKKGWYLESCATVQYALGKHKTTLSYKDLKVDSRYNTYKYTGLPPGPICNPGKGSINAALYPAQTEDMFFVAGSSGTHMFSRYFSEHLSNKALRKKRKREMNR